MIAAQFDRFDDGSMMYGILYDIIHISNDFWIHLNIIFRLNIL